MFFVKKWSILIHISSWFDWQSSYAKYRFKLWKHFSLSLTSFCNIPSCNFWCLLWVIVEHPPNSGKLLCHITQLRLGVCLISLRKTYLFGFVYTSEEDIILLLIRTEMNILGAPPFICLWSAVIRSESTFESSHWLTGKEITNEFPKQRMLDGWSWWRLWNWPASGTILCNRFSLHVGWNLLACLSVGGTADSLKFRPR